MCSLAMADGTHVFIFVHGLDGEPGDWELWREVLEEESRLA